jgi:23S rRNA (guanosine2251-2'-O)-methyltransferase
VTQLTGPDPSEWVYGIIAVEEVFRAGRRRVMELWMASGERNPRLAMLRQLAGGISIREASSRELDRRTQGGRHQGVLARVSPYPWCELHRVLETRGPLLFLDGIQDPHNLGAIVRSCAALGAQGIVLENRRSAPLTPVVAKAACGGLEHIWLCRVTNLPRALEEAKKAGFWIVGTQEDGGSVLWEADLPDRVAVGVGGGGSGLRRVVRRACDLWVSIRCEGAIRTLNASVAVGMVLYELARRRTA